MKNLLQTHSISWAESVRLVLESEGIEAVVLDPNAPGFIGFAGRTRVAVMNDDDLPRAQEILRRIEGPKTPPPPSWRWQKRGLFCVGLAFLLIFVFAGTVDPDDINLLNWITVAACGLFLVAGFALIALGPRADKNQDHDHERG
jgi:putative signal transducing protein